MFIMSFISHVVDYVLQQCGENDIGMLKGRFGCLLVHNAELDLDFNATSSTSSS